MYSLDKSNRYFLKNGKPHFFLADTAWMAFSHLTLDEFEQYACFRAAQGFNAILVMNTPAFSDMSDNVRALPFAVNDDGSFDLSRINIAYFDQAEQKLAVMQRQGLTPCILVMHGAYLRGCSLEQAFDCKGKQFERWEDFTRFVDYSVARYKKYHPVWLGGGDVTLAGEVLRHYTYVSRTIREQCPDDILTSHVPDSAYIPSKMIDDRLIDLYVYQSGHNFDREEDAEKPAEMASRYFARKPRLPIMNIEPMYEAHGFGNRFGRFGAFFIRRAFWYSVLSGANAGFVYGAHGVWMFFERQAAFNNEHWSKIPLPWRTALTLPGSYDTVHNARLFQQYGMFNLRPRQDMNLTPYQQIKVAASEDESLIVAYTPYSNCVDLPLDLDGYDCVWHLLDQTKRTVRAQIQRTSGKELAARTAKITQGQKHPVELPSRTAATPVISRVEMYPHNCDAVLVCIRR